MKMNSIQSNEYGLSHVKTNNKFIHSCWLILINYHLSSSVSHTVLVGSLQQDRITTGHSICVRKTNNNNNTYYYYYYVIFCCNHLPRMVYNTYTGLVVTVDGSWGHVKNISSLHILEKNGLWVKIVTTSPGLPYALWLPGFARVPY